MAKLLIRNNSIITDDLEDGITSAIVGMDYLLHDLHLGKCFTAYYTLTTAATDEHRTGLYIKTPSVASGILVHIIVSFSASSAAVFSICEAPTIAANVGTHAVVMYNRYRDSTVTSSCYDNATAPAVGKFTTLTEAQIAGDGTWDTGTVIRTEPLVAGAGPKPAGGNGVDTQKYILKANTKYVFLITNTVAEANTHHILIDWSEYINL